MNDNIDDKVPTSPPICWLSDPACGNPSVVGNKASVLHNLTSLGYPVPSGFCITTEAAELGISASLVTEIKKALKSLPPLWAVRSSSNAEDSTGLAFPGVFSTKLAISSCEGVVEAVADVLRSCKSSVLERYAHFHRYSLEKVRMAVLVQRMVDAKVSGVAFSRHPVTGEDLVVIESSYGLGPSVVDGSVIPDTVQVSRSGECRLTKLGTKRTKLIVDNQCAIRIPTTDAERLATSISDLQARAIAKMIREVEEEFGTPQDMEWAYSEDDTFYLLQARPITTPFPISQEKGSRL